jgi:hypothetical protein
MERAAKDIKRLLLDTYSQIESEDKAQHEDMDTDFADILNLWDEKSGLVKSGVSYADSVDSLAEGYDGADGELSEGYGTVLEDE